MISSLGGFDGAEQWVNPQASLKGHANVNHYSPKVRNEIIWNVNWIQDWFHLRVSQDLDGTNETQSWNKLKGERGPYNTLAIHYGTQKHVKPIKSKASQNSSIHGLKVKIKNMLIYNTCQYINSTCKAWQHFKSWDHVEEPNVEFTKKPLSVNHTKPHAQLVERVDQLWTAEWFL